MSDGVCAVCVRPLPPSAFGRAGATTGVCVRCRVASRPRTRRLRTRVEVRPGWFCCARCRDAKPRHLFSVGVRADGQTARDSYCRPCRRAYNKRRMLSPAVQVRHRIAQRRQEARRTADRTRARQERTAFVVGWVRRWLGEGATLTELGRRLGVPRQTVRKWRDGDVGRGVRPAAEAKVAALVWRRVGATGGQEP